MPKAEDGAQARAAQAAGSAAAVSVAVPASAATPANTAATASSATSATSASSAAPKPQAAAVKRLGAKAKWYAMQVTAGSEALTIRHLNNYLQDVVNLPQFSNISFPEELFTPRYKVVHQQGDIYVSEEKLLLPGYVIAVTRDVSALNEATRRVHMLAKVLGNEKAFIALDRSEIEWLQRFTTKGYRTIDMSEGFKEGGRVVVTQGPLIGCEAMISKINRRKREAYVTIPMMGRMVQVRMGFHLVRKA